MEGKHVMARSSFGWGRGALVVAGASCLVFGTGLGAQSTRTKGKDAKAILVVPALQSSDKMLGYNAAVEIRTHIDDNADTRVEWVVPQDRIEETLLQSDFPPHDPVSDLDAKILAKSLSADYYIIGTAAHGAGTDVVLNTKFVINQTTQFGDALVQPLPTAQANKVGKAADMVAKSLEDAMKQIPQWTKCSDDAKKKAYPEALSAAHEAIVAYPRSTLARICIATVYAETNQPQDSMLSISKEILTIDPHNRLALNYAATAAYAKNDLDAATQYWSQQLAADPSNTALVEDVVNKIVSAGRINAAVPIIDTAVAENPNDAKLMGLKYKLLIKAGDWAKAIPVGDSVIREDTSFADTVFYQRQTAAYESDSEPQRAAEIAAQGLSKFPGNLTLEMAEIDAQSRSGQTQQEIATLHKFLAANPKNLVFWRFLYQSFTSTNQSDSALWVLHQAAANGDTASTLAKFAFGQGAKLYKAGNASKNRDTLEMAIHWLSYSDTLSASPEAKFLIGASQAAIGANEVTDAFKEKNCAQLKDVQDNLTAANGNLQAGGSFSPQAAAQLLDYIRQALPPVGKLMTQQKCH